MIRFLALFALLLNQIVAQDSVEYFPASLNINPFFANQLEPKMGSLFDVGDNKLRLDIGNTVDIIQKKINDKETLSFGADFFTYSLLRRQKDFKFPVEAIDYLFGINMAYIIKSEQMNYGLRFRISHISAHLVDGSYSVKNSQWRENNLPFVYSREFFELTPFIELHNLRLYSAITLIYHVKPSELGKDSYQIGGEYVIPNIISDNIFYYVAGDFKLIHLDKYNGIITLQTGLQFGNNSLRGLRIYYEYFSGKNIHGELFYQNITKSALGINFDL
ncbi:MAG: DUF1207 domain-containing protein [Ignavibacteriales bacterium]